jgi:hypothetical protein
MESWSATCRWRDAVRDRWAAAGAATASKEDGGGERGLDATVERPSRGRVAACGADERRRERGGVAAGPAVGDGGRTTAARWRWRRRRGVRGGAEVAGGGCRAHLGRRRARSSPVGRRRPPAHQIPAGTGGGVAGRASSNLADDGVNGWGVQGAARVVVSGGRCWCRAAADGDDEWIWMVRPVVEMNG